MSVSGRLPNNMGKAEQYQERQYQQDQQDADPEIIIKFPLNFGSLNQHTSICSKFFQDSFITQDCGYHPKALNVVHAFFSVKEPSVFSPTQVILTKDIYNCCNVISKENNICFLQGT